MASDPQQVGPRAVLKAIARVKREGTTRVLEHLERVEPDLASFVMEEPSLVHRDVLHTGATAGQARRLQRRIESVVLVAVTALRAARDPA
jgi:hypothetical protein